MDNILGSQKDSDAAMSTGGQIKAVEAKLRKLASKKKSGAAWQHVAEKERDIAHRGAEGSAYWGTFEMSAGPTNDPDGYRDEDRHANPESAVAHQKHWPTVMRNEEIQQETVERVRKMMEQAQQVLTDAQYNVYVLTMLKSPALSNREAAKVLGLSRQMVDKHATAIKSKLRRIYEERT